MPQTATNKRLKAKIDKAVNDSLQALDDIEYSRREAMVNLGDDLQAIRAEVTPAEFSQMLVKVKDHPNVNAVELAKALGISRARLYELIET